MKMICRGKIFMKKYMLSIILILIFADGFYLIIRSSFETFHDQVTSFPLNKYRRMLGLFITSVSFLLLTLQNLLIIKERNDY